jgi:hypothetical protein
MNLQHMRLPAAGLAAMLTLAGCWGSNDDAVVAATPPPAVIAEVPDSAGVSVAAFFTYLASLSATDEASEPLSIKATFAVPPDDSSEPTPLT